MPSTALVRLVAILLLQSATGLVAGQAVDAGRQAITIAMTAEPPNLNSMRMTDLVSFFVIGHINEGLLRYDRRGQLAPGVAESWAVQPGKITFKLRKDARWQDGSPVTAHDFVYAWRRVNDPKEAAPFAAIMYPLANAEKVQQGQLPVTKLGVRAEDDRTLVMQLERPCGYCLALVSHGTFFPVQAAFHQAAGSNFGGEAQHLLANGPFKMTEWTHESSMLLVKNDAYWNRDQIHLNEIKIGYITTDNRARLNLFRDNQIALVRLGTETVQDAASQGMRLRIFESGGLSYIWFNHRKGRATRHKVLRRAIQLVFDPEVFVNQVIAIPGYKPARSLFPTWMKTDAGRFADTHPPPAIKRDPTAAKALLAQLSESEGPLPKLSLLTVASPTGAKVAEYLQGLLRQTLNLDVKVDQQSFKQYLSKARQGDFDLALASWY
ncbi:MAG: peptide ABC transporter substrate-binding protein, partial [Pseudomonadales bacterium]